MLGELKYVKADELAPLLAEKSIEERKHSKSEQIVIFDVRGEEEFSEGHINGAINLPSTKWANGDFVDEVIRQYINADEASGAGKTVILHCAHSQQRGPTCARVLQQEFQKRVESSGFDLTSLPEIRVLKDGFAHFEEEYGSNAALMVQSDKTLYPKSLW